MTVTVEPVHSAHPHFDRAAELFDAYRVHYGQSGDLAATRAWLAEQIEQRRVAVVVALLAGQVRGLITTAVIPASLALGTAWLIRDLYVEPAYRRTGTAQALLRHVIADARASGAYRLSLQTEADNAAARRLYARLGFEPVDGLELLNLPIAAPAT